MSSSVRDTSPLAEGGPSELRNSAVLRFALSGLAVLLLVGVVGTYLVGEQSEEEALRRARERTRILGHGIIEPVLADGLLNGEPAAVEALDRVVRERVLVPPVVRVKVWDRDGRILYSDEPRLIGSQYTLDEDELEAFGTNQIEAYVSDLSGPENRFERDRGELLEVYMALNAPDGSSLLFETYLDSASIASEQRRLGLRFLPVLLIALLLLWLTQLPLARSMSHRLREGQLDRERLLRRAIEASDTERRRVAHDLHDGVIQDLAGLSYELAAAADTADRDGAAGLKGRLTTASAETRRSMRQLRSLLIDIYPPNLHTAGLPSVLADLASSIQTRGMRVELEVPEEIDLPTETEALVFRVAQEGIRNAMAHSGAACVRVELAKMDGLVSLGVIDDGVDFSKQDLERRRAEGHIGLRLLEEFVADAGGKLTVDSEPGAGTKMRVEVPAS